MRELTSLLRKLHSFFAVAQAIGLDTWLKPSQIVQRFGLVGVDFQRFAILRNCPSNSSGGCESLTQVAVCEWMGRDVAERLVQ